MATQIMLGDIPAEVVYKDIKNVYFRVYAPTGRVRISAPKRMDLDTIRALAGAKLAWIKRRQATLRERPREAPRRYVDGELHYVWGDLHTLTVAHHSEPPSIESADGRMSLRVHAGADVRKRRAVVESWYREQVRKAVVPLLATWQPRMGVEVKRVFVRRMKTMWGSCNCRAGTIRLNTELARRSPQGLEYVVVHELAHLLEPSHNARFSSLMDGFMPDWRLHRDALNRPPDRRED